MLKITINVLRSVAFGAALMLVLAVAVTSPGFTTQADAAVPPSGRGGMCGGFAGVQCKPGLFCDFRPRARCGAGDMSGVCHVRPQFCTMNFNPVCGCDGVTYSNDCKRRAAGAGKASNRQCR